MISISKYSKIEEGSADNCFTQILEIRKCLTFVIRNQKKLMIFVPEFLCSDRGSDFKMQCCLVDKGQDFILDRLI